MSDLLLVGQSPTQTVGEEFFLHCMDWWYEILQAIEACVDESYPFDALFYRDVFLAPMTAESDGWGGSEPGGDSHGMPPTWPTAGGTEPRYRRLPRRG